MSENICNFCCKTYANKYILKTHQKTSKSCLKIQNKDRVDNFECKYCDKKFPYKRRLNDHLSNKHSGDVIREEYEKKLSEQREYYEKKIRELETDMKEVAIKASTKPTLVKNTYIQNNLQPLKEEDFKANLDKFTPTTIMNGPDGIGKYALEFPLKGKIVCVDTARKVVKFKNEDGDIIEDPEMTKISLMLFKSLTSPTDEYRQIVDDELEILKKGGVKYYYDIMDVMNDISLTAKGYETKLKRNVAKYVCNRVKI